MMVCCRSTPAATCGERGSVPQSAIQDAAIYTHRAAQHFALYRLFFASPDPLPSIAHLPEHKSLRVLSLQEQHAQLQINSHRHRDTEKKKPALTVCTQKTLLSSSADAAPKVNYSSGRKQTVTDRTLLDNHSCAEYISQSTILVPLLKKENLRVYLRMSELSELRSEHWKNADVVLHSMMSSWSESSCVVKHWHVVGKKDSLWGGQ